MSTQSTEVKNNPWRRRIAVLVGVAISVIFLFLAFRGLQPQEFLASLSDVSLPLLLLGAAVYGIAVVIIAWRWQFLLSAFSTVPLMSLTGIVAIGYMGNNVYPLRAGEALRVFFLKRDHDVAVTSAATTVVIERIFDGIVMLTFILLGVLALDVQSREIQQVTTIAAPLFLIAVIVFFTLAAFPRRLQQLIEWIARFLPERLAQLVLTLHEGILAGLRGLRSPRQLVGAVFASYATWAVEAGVYWIVMQAFDLDLSYAVALLAVGVVNLAGLIPASPGMVGVYEFFVSSVLILFGVPQNDALAYAIVVHLVIWAPVTLTGFGLLVRRGMGWSAIARAQELEATVAESGRPSS